MKTLEIEHLTKVYPAFTLDDVSFSVESGRIMGFIGRNGAGKSTTLKCLLGFVHKDGGTVKFFGKDFSENEKEIKSRVGYVSGGADYYVTKKLKTITAVTKRFYENFDDTAYRGYLEKFNLDENKTVKALSQGMKVKYSLALALSHNADLLILDEPTAGLDPRGRDEILDQISYLQKERGITVILVSHSMEDVARYVDRLIVMNQGEVRFDGTPKEVFRHYKELEEIGLAAPQVTYLMQELKEKGASVDTEATTVEEAAETIEKWLRQR